MPDEFDPFADDVYEDNEPDAEYLDDAETLSGDYPDEQLDTSYAPPDREPRATKWGTTDLEQALGEPLELRLAEEEPDIDADTPHDETRAGRLVAPDEGAHARLETDLIATDAGIAGSAASAEEAAMHIVDDGDG